MYEIISICAIGAGLEISGDLDGSLRDVFEGKSFQGKASILTQAQWLQLFAKKDRLEAARIYHACVKNINIESFDKQNRDILKKVKFECNSQNKLPYYIFKNGRKVKTEIGELDTESMVGRFFIGIDNSIYRINQSRDLVKDNETVKKNLSRKDRAIQIFQFQKTKYSRDSSLLIDFQEAININKIEGNRLLLEWRYIRYLNHGGYFTTIVERVWRTPNGKMEKIAVLAPSAKCTRRKITR